MQVHAHELHVHCYRMLASFHEAEDAVQETFLRAWKAREQFDGQHLRAWLYTIATRVCIDVTRARARRGTEVTWLEPYPDALLDPGDEPDAVAVARETVELAFLTALQVLPPRQRAALLAREVLGLTAAETADLLGVSVAAANSAVQRARETMRGALPRERSEWSVGEVGAEEQELLARFVDAHERLDAAAALAVAAEDIRITMPPLELEFTGRDGIAPLLERAFGPERDGDWKLLPTSANRMPAAVSYLRKPGETESRAFKVDVLRVVDGEIAEITTFGPQLFVAAGMPEVLAG